MVVEIKTAMEFMVLWEPEVGKLIQVDGKQRAGFLGEVVPELGSEG